VSYPISRQVIIGMEIQRVSGKHQQTLI
jgi:hypothetical protein